MKNIFTLILLLCLLLAGSLQSAAQGDANNHSATIKKVLAYMECDECTDGELSQILQIKEKAFAYLLAILEKGPSGTRIASFRQQLEIQYDNLNKNDTAVTDKTKYINHYVQNTFNRYYKRSAHAIATIGGAEAKAALLKAAENVSMNSNVRAYINELLKYLN